MEHHPDGQREFGTRKYLKIIFLSKLYLCNKASVNNQTPHAGVPLHTFCFSVRATEQSAINIPSGNEGDILITIMSYVKAFPRTEPIDNQ